ncbi:MAG TPA: glycoside hydrolase family 43 protein [Sphingomicrobium sp.]|nr:glycoside hydrolase family 43 protein [Sphingomicrobium sp.]
MFWKASLGTLSLLFSIVATADARVPVRATYTNPVIDADFPDPDVISGPDGSYYAYATQTQRNGRWIDIQIARSTDLVHWRYLGDALPMKPRWAANTQDFWAPDVVREGRQYLLYFSAKPDASVSDPKQGMCLGVATASSPAGPFTDIGHPLQCGEGFVNIDPTEFDDPATGKHWLYWGSGFAPIKVQELAPDLLSFARGSSPINLVAPNPVKGAFPVLVEGSWVVRHDGWYYLFYSGDNCCGPKANYAVMVARSRSATGPFETLEQANGTPHSIILKKSSRFVAPGHNSTVTDRAGRDWIIYHAVDAHRPRDKAEDGLNTRRVLLIDRIRWQRGWPVISPPSADPKPAPASRSRRQRN